MRPGWPRGFTCSCALRVLANPELGTLRQSIRECMGSIYTCAAQIKIDGSERAKRIAAEALDRVTDLARQLDSPRVKLRGERRRGR